DFATTNQATAITINVLAGATDQDGDPLSLSGVSSGATTPPSTTITTFNGASVSVVGGQVVCDPTTSAFFQSLGNDQTSPDSFYYTIGDGHGGTATASVNMNIF